MKVPTVSHAAFHEALLRALMGARGDTSAELRRSIEAHTAHLSGRPRTGDSAELPSALVPYVEKVALHAYRVTDTDIDDLRKAGYSEDAVFEVTLSAAVGAGLARLERGMAALRGTL